MEPPSVLSATANEDDAAFFSFFFRKLLSVLETLPSKTLVVAETASAVSSKGWKLSRDKYFDAVLLSLKKVSKISSASVFDSFFSSETCYDKEREGG